MPLLARAIHAPLAIEVKADALADLAGFLAGLRISAAGQVAVAVGPGMGSELGDLVREQLDRADVITLAGGSLESALEFGDKLNAGSYDAAIAIGGGKTVDTVKYAASQQGMPMVAVGTSLAHDGIASPVSVLTRHNVSYSYGVHTPIAVMVDLDFVRRCPARHTRAGIGDALSNLSAVADWRLAHQLRGEPLDGLATALASAGAEALLGHPGTIKDDEFLTALANALILGGVAMSVAGSSRPCSGGCHEIAHAVDGLYPGVALHGELVGLGALFCTLLRGDDRRFLELSKALQRHGLPRVPGEVGLTDEQFAQAVDAAPATRPDRYTILEHLALTGDGVRTAIADLTSRLRS